MICLDTNAIIAVIRGQPIQVRERLRTALRTGERVGVSVIALFELIFGYEKSVHRTRNKEAVRSFLALDVELLSFEPADAEHAGEIRAALQRTGTPIGEYDLLIAAQARRHAATLVTANRREFARVPGLDVVDWSA
jgi:tRNA(fMet)-specific endonuclease VapC